MGGDVESKIVEYMNKTRFATLTTIGRKSKEPKSTIIYYENSGFEIYFNTGRGTEKVKNIAANPSVAIAVHYSDPSAKDVQDTRGLLYSGVAMPIDGAEFKKVPGGVINVYDMVNSHFPNNAVIFKVIPKRISFIDYSLGFGHRDILDFASRHL